MLEAQDLLLDAGAEACALYAPTPPVARALSSIQQRKTNVRNQLVESVVHSVDVSRGDAGDQRFLKTTRKLDP
jgi:hypothetical protein